MIDRDQLRKWYKEEREAQSASSDIDFGQNNIAGMSAITGATKAEGHLDEFGDDSPHWSQVGMVTATR